MSLDIYQENILDHYEHPRNLGHLTTCSAKAHDTNPLCGDTWDFEILVEKKKIKEIKYNGHGCAISTASASMLSEKLQGMKIEAAVKLEKEDILELLGIELSAVRLKCALLPLKVMKLSVYDYIDQTKKK